MQLLLTQLSSASCYFLSLDQILLSVPCFQTLSVYICPLRWETKFHTCIKQGVKITLLCIFIFNFYWNLFNKLTIFQPSSIDYRMMDWSSIEKDLEGSRYGLIKLLSYHFLEENVFSYGYCMYYMSFMKSLEMWICTRHW